MPPASPRGALERHSSDHLVGHRPTMSRSTAPWAARGRGVSSTRGYTGPRAAVVQWIGLHPPKVVIGFRVPAAALAMTYWNVIVLPKVLSVTGSLAEARRPLGTARDPAVDVGTVPRRRSSRQSSLRSDTRPTEMRPLIATRGRLITPSRDAEGHGPAHPPPAPSLEGKRETTHSPSVPE